MTSTQFPARYDGDDTGQAVSLDRAQVNYLGYLENHPNRHSSEDSRSTAMLNTKCALLLRSLVARIMRGGFFA